MELDLNLELEGEFNRFIKVWTAIVTSLTYCYLISKVIPKGKVRLFCFLPIICTFTYLPLALHSINFSSTTGFLIAWLGNFKLLLFAFDKGPLSSSPSLSLPFFIFLACLPIRIRTNPPPSTNSEAHNKSGPDHSSSLHYAVKGLVLVLLTCLLAYRHSWNTYVFSCLCCFHAFFSLQIILATSAAIARSLLGLELEPHFSSPYLSTSLQDFWGKRWNLVVSGILRETVYEHVCPIYRRAFGKRLSLCLAVVTTFLVSGLMHELIFFYLTRFWPTWEILLWFFIYGICLVLEIEVKKKVKGRWQLHQCISRTLTIAFVIVTCFFWILPQFLRTSADAIAEYSIAWEFIKEHLITATMNSFT